MSDTQNSTLLTASLRGVSTLRLLTSLADSVTFDASSTTVSEDGRLPSFLDTLANAPLSVVKAESFAETQRCWRQRRRRRRALNAFFAPQPSPQLGETDSMTSATSENRVVLRDLVQRTRCSLAKVSTTHATLMDLLVEQLCGTAWQSCQDENHVAARTCGRQDADEEGDVPGTQEHGRDGRFADWTLGEKLLYVVLRTSAVPLAPGSARQRATTSAASTVVPCDLLNDDEQEEAAADGVKATQRAMAPDVSVGSAMTIGWSLTEMPTTRPAPLTAPAALPIGLRCWLAPSIIAIIENSAVMMRRLRWSCDADPVVQATLCSSSGGDVGWRGSHADGTWSCDSADPSLDSLWHLPSPHSDLTPSESGVARRSHWRIWEDSRSMGPSAAAAAAADDDDGDDEAVRRLFARRGRSLSRHESMLRLSADTSKEVVAGITDDGAAGAGVHATPFAFFAQHYPTALCDMVFVALHYCVIGAPDPYLLTILGPLPEKEVVGGQTRRPETVVTKMDGREPNSVPDASVQAGSGDTPTLHLRVCEDLLRGSGAPITFSDTAATAADVAAKTRDTTTAPDLSSQTRKRRKGEQMASTQATASRATTQYDALPHRGLVSMLQWACICGSRFLRLERLVACAAAAERRAALGSYGRSALEALRGCLSLLRGRALGLMQGRVGGAHGIDLDELFVAQRRLANIDTCVRLLCDVFGVCDQTGGGEGQGRCGDDNDEEDVTAAALHRLSSATLLSTLYERLCMTQIHAACLPPAQQVPPTTATSFNRVIAPAASAAADDDDDEEGEAAQRTAATCATVKPTPHTEAVASDIAVTDLLAVLFVAVLQPFHRMLHAWLTSGRLRDPFDEFFVIANGPTCRLSPSPLRLPSFLSLATARTVLRAGLARRAVRLAATTLRTLTRDERRRVEAALLLETTAQEDETRQLCRDVATLHDAIGAFMDSLPDGVAGQRLPQPCVSPLRPEGAVTYWRDYLQACNAVLLHATMAAQMPLAGEGAAVRTTGTTPVAEDDEDSTRTLGSELQSRRECSTLLGLRNSSDGVSGASPSLVSTSAVSVASCATAALYGLVSHEMQYFATQRAALQQMPSDADLSRVEPVAGVDTDSPVSPRHLRELYEIRTLAQRRAARLVEWKVERLALRVARLQAVQTIVDELREVYDVVKDTGDVHVTVRPLSPSVPRLPGRFAVVLYPDEKGGPARKPRRASVPRGVTVVSFATAVSVSQGASQQSNSGTVCVTHQVTAPGDAIDDGRAAIFSESVMDEGTAERTSATGAGAAASQANATSTATTTPTTRQETEAKTTASHAVDLFAIADINDEVFLSRRVGPLRRGAYSDTTVEALAALSRAARDTRDASIDNKAYLACCIKQARETCAAEAHVATLSTPRPGDADGVAAAGESEGKGGSGGITEVVRGPWAADFCALCRRATSSSPFLPVTSTRDVAHDEGDMDVLRPISLAAVQSEIADAACPGVDLSLKLTAVQHKALRGCASYYSAVGDTLGKFWGRKALQLLLVPRYGALHRLLSRLHDVCLLQLPSLAARLTTDWCHLLVPAMDEEMTVFASTVDVRCRVDELDKVFAREWTADDVTCDVRWVYDDPCTATEAEGEKVADTAGVISAEVAALRLLTHLQLQCTHSFDASQLVSARLIRLYGQVFCALIAWKVVDGLLARVWRVGLQCGVTDVFFFCGAARQVLLSVQQYVWYSICILSTRHRARFMANYGSLYACNQPLEHFAHDHAHFVDACCWAALQGETWASCRRLLHALVAEVSDAARAVRLSNCVASHKLQDSHSCPARRGVCPAAASGELGRSGGRSCGGYTAGHAQPIVHATHDKTTGWIAVTTRTRGGLPHRVDPHRADENDTRREATVICSRNPSGSSRCGSASGTSHRRASTSHRTSATTRHETCSEQQECAAAGLQEMIERQHRFVRDVVRRRMRAFAACTSRLVEELKAARDQTPTRSVETPVDACVDEQDKTMGEHACIGHGTSPANWRQVLEDQRGGLDALIDTLSTAVALMESAV